jgi:hypothetical protein
MYLVDCIEASEKVALIGSTSLHAFPLVQVRLFDGINKQTPLGDTLAYSHVHAINHGEDAHEKRNIDGSLLKGRE